MSGFPVPERRHAIKAPLPPDEAGRLRALQRYDILDTEPEQDFDDITVLASQICGMPIAIITLVDENRQWFKSKIGMTENGTSRDIAFCAHGILHEEAFIVEDTLLDERFKDNPLVRGNTGIRFYAGAALVTPDGHVLGMLCVNDLVPRTLTPEQLASLQVLSRQVVTRLELRRNLKELEQTIKLLKEGEKELRWKTAFLESNVKSSLDGIVVVDSQGKKVLQNPKATDLWKIPLNIAGDTDNAKQVEWMSNMTKEPGPFIDKISYLYSHPDEISRDEIELKNGRVLDCYSSPVLGPDGVHHGRIWSFRDITERKLLENTLRESQELFTDAFDQAPNGIALVAMDGHWLKVNRALCALVGYSEENLLTGNFQDITHPEDLALDMEFFRQIVAGDIQTYQMEKRYIHHSGHFVPVLLNVSLIRDGQGQPRYFISQIQDITERKRIELAAVEAKKFLQSTLNSLSAHIAILDETGVVIAVNRAWDQFGNDNQSIGNKGGIGKNYLEICDSAGGDFSVEAPEAALGIRAVMTGELDEFNLEYPCHSPEEKRWFILRATCFDGQTGRRVVVAHENISARKVAEEELKATHAQLEQLLAQSPVVLYRLKIVGQHVIPLMAGGNIFSMLGCTEEESLSKNWWLEHLHPEDMEKGVAEISETLKTGHSRREYRILHKNGSYRWVDDNQRLYRGQLGDPEEVVGVWTDITERKQSERKLQESERRFSDMLKNVELASMMLDPEGTITYCNDFLLRLTGWKRREIMGRNWIEVFVPPELKQEELSIHQALIAGQPDALHHENKIMTQSGEHRFIRWNNSVLRSVSGGVVGSASIGEDTTERKEAEESLRLLSSAVSQSKESIMITDAQLDLPGPRILFINPAFTKMTGYSLEEVLGKTPRMLQGADTDRSVLQRLRKNLENGKTFQGETTNYRKDGSTFYLEWQVAPIYNVVGIVTHYVAVERDISERKKAEHELRETHKQLLDVSRQAGMAEIATNILHNVGNVLNSVNVSASLLEDGVRKSKVSSLGKVVALLQEHQSDLAVFFSSNPQGQKLPEYLARLSEHLLGDQSMALMELDSLRANIEHIKQIVAVQQNYAKVSGIKEVIDVRELVEDSLRMNLGALDRHKVMLIREMDDVPPLYAEKHKILQILVNLVSNAKHACSESPGKDKKITLRVAQAGGFLRIAVIDNGIGILPENLTRLFNHGFTTRKDGHGFGLHGGALAALEMGGSLTAQSGGSEKGSCFTLELPSKGEIIT